MTDAEQPIEGYWCEVCKCFTLEEFLDLEPRLITECSNCNYEGGGFGVKLVRLNP